MVEKISVEIGLEGGDEVERQLADIGEAGKKTFGDLQSSADQIDFSSVSDQFQTVATAIDTAQTAVKSAAGFESIIQGVRNVEGAFETLGVAATKMAARMTRSLGLIGVALRALGPMGIAVGAVGGALIKFGNDAAESINQVNASAAKLGITFQQFDALSRGLQQAGISSDAASAGFEHLQSAGLNVAQALPQIIAQLQALPDGVNRTNLAISLLGEKLGVEVVAALRTGSLAYNQFSAATSKTTEEQRNNAALQEQSLNKLSAAWNEFKADVATPIAIPLFDLIKTGLEQIRQGIATTKQEWAVLANLLTQITPKVGIDISLTGSLQPQLDEAARKLDEIKEKGKQAAQEPTIAFTAWGEAIRMAGAQGAQAGQAVATGAVTAGQAAQQSALIFTQWGTVAQQVGSQAAAAAQQAAQATAQSGQQVQQNVGFWQNLSDAVDVSTAQIVNFASSLGSITWDVISSAGVAAWNALTGAIQGAIDKLLVFIGLKPQAPATGGGAPGKASGGLLGGRGTGTSDSNLAWVSRGEYITPARAVGQPGVLSFLEALRRSGGNLSRVLDGMGRFALGGMVRGPIPAFAGGGLAGGMNNVTIQFPGLPAIGGLRASSDVVDQLHRAAALAQVRSGGRKPSRYS